MIDEIMGVIALLTSIVGLAVALVKLAREVDGLAVRRKKKGRHFKSDDLTH